MRGSVLVNSVQQKLCKKSLKVKSTWFPTNLLSEKGNIHTWEWHFDFR